MDLTLAALTLAFLVPAEPSETPLHVAVMSLPSDGEPEGHTGQLAKELAAHLRQSGFRVTEAGVSERVPSEEAAAILTQSGADFAIGVRAARGCPVLLLPPAATEPTQTQPVSDQAALATLVRQILAASRYKYGAAAARGLKDAARWCAGRPDKVEGYVLSAVPSPTLLLRMPSGSVSSALLESIPKALREARSGP